MVDQKINISEVLNRIHDFFEEGIPFNKVLGLRVESLDMDSFCVKIEMKEDLIGNPIKKIFLEFPSLLLCLQLHQGQKR